MSFQPLSQDPTITLPLPNNVRGNERPTQGLHSDRMLPVAICIVSSFKVEIPRKATNQESELPGIYIRGSTIQSSGILSLEMRRYDVG